MQRKAAIKLIVVLLLIAAIGTLAFTGLNIKAFEVVPFYKAISQGLDLKGGISVVYQGIDEGQDDFSTLLNGTVSILQNRLTGQGYSEATVALQGSDKIRVEIPDVSDPSAVIDIIGTPAVLKFQMEDGSVVLSGSNIKEAKAGYYEGVPVVYFELDQAGSDAFAKATAAAYSANQTIQILLDGKVISAPSVKSVISTGSGMIEGVGSIEECQRLAMLIMSGALPLTINQISVSTISATLGANALSTSITAGLIGIALVMLFMILVYRLPGLIADIALFLYIVLDLLLLAVLPGIQLTLPGIAGIILSIGMAVDANIIIFERLKEEVRNGKTLRAAVEAAYKRATVTILDSNVTTLIACIVLMIFGTGTIKGFAYTLTIGVLVSMFTCLVVSKFLLRNVVALGIGGHSLYVSKGLFTDNKEKKRFSFSKNLKWTLLIPAVILIAAIAVGAVSGGMNLGVDFAGGTMITVNLNEENYNLDDVKSAMANQAVTDATYSTTESGGVHSIVIRMKDTNDAKQEDAIRAGFENQIKQTYPNAVIENVERVGAVAGAELIRNTILSCVIAAACMLIYIAIRFQWVSGVTAVIAIIIDVLMMAAVITIIRMQINSSFIAAVLTIIGYAINDTIVIFDRIRENNKKYAHGTMTRREVADISVYESLGRTINTTITSLVTIVVLYILGVQSIREFALPLIVGMLAGNMTSIFIAPSLWGLWMDKKNGTKKEKEPKKA
ncbi:MAG: protein translocase subunit SecD [Clostridia bacterium]|nr:protein translocase subunit SecD [Clostridia bacterium]